MTDNSIHTTNRNDMSKQQEHQVIEELWLLYFSEYLYVKGAIDEALRNRINAIIKAQSRAVGK